MAIDEALQVRAALSQSTASGDAIVAVYTDAVASLEARVAGADGKTRFAIENATRTRIVVANTHIHILGSAANIKVARDAICDLIIGAPPGKVYNRMRTVAKRLNARL